MTALQGSGPRRHNRGEQCPDCGHIHEQCLGHARHRNEERAAAAHERWGHGPPWPCMRIPTIGLEVCKMHGGGSPAARKAAAENIAAAKAEKALRRRLGTTTATPVINPAVELARLAGELRAWYDESKALVAELDVDSAAASGVDALVGGDLVPAGAVDVHPMVKLHERAQERLAKVLADMERIGIAHHLADIEEAKAAALFAAFVQGLQAAGVDTPEVRQAIAVQVRALEAGEPA